MSFSVMRAPMNSTLLPTEKMMFFGRRKRKMCPLLKSVNFPQKLMVWGAMTSSGLSDLHVVKGRTSINSEYYSQEILQNHLLPIYTRNFTTGPVHRRKMVSAKCRSTFMQDGATCHTSVETSRWLQTHQIPFWEKGVWLPNSPDLNPIENLWAIVEQEVKSLKDSPQNLEQLEKYLNKAWSSIKPEILENFISSMPDRIKCVIRVKGKIVLRK